MVYPGRIPPVQITTKAQIIKVNHPPADGEPQAAHTDLLHSHGRLLHLASQQVIPCCYTLCYAGH